MTIFEKAYWSVSGDTISVNMPISKIDKERRIVSGWATTDAIDKQGDIIPIEASKSAFDKFKGNVREQHNDKLAVGKVISFRQDKLFDKASGEFVNGIFVDVYISKGAESTWHKINEEILTGFSIGGAIRDSESVYNKSMGETVRIIKDYDLSELSVVDNPANPLSDFVSIQKFDTEAVESVEKNFLENVYWCPTSEAVIVSDKPDYACPECNKGMTNIGFVESNDTQKSEAIAALVDSIEKSHEVSEESDLEAIDKSIANSNEKEGNIVGFLNRKTTVVEEFVTKADEVVAEDAVVVEEVVEETEVVEKAADEVAQEVTEELVEKSADEVEAVEEATAPEGSDDLEKADAEVTVAESIMTAIADLGAVVKSLSDQLSEVKKSLEAEVTSIKSDVTKFADRVESVEADTAVRKSGDLGGIVQEQRIEKSKWGGRFLKTADLYRNN